MKGPFGMPEMLVSIDVLANYIGDRDAATSDHAAIGFLRQPTAPRIVSWQFSETGGRACPAARFGLF